VTAGSDDGVQASEGWRRLEDAGLQGLVYLIGAPDTGKSTLSRYLYGRLLSRGKRVAYLDGDPGQSVLGPPATITAAMPLGPDDAFPPRGPKWRRFLGSVSPRGHMLPLVVGARRLLEVVTQAGAETVLYDTAGLVDPGQGGLTLKLAEIDLLQPWAVIALQHDSELEPLLVPLRRSRATRVLTLAASPDVQRRSPAQRQAYRAAQFERYFAGSRTHEVEWRFWAVFPAPRFPAGRLVSIEDTEGFVRALGIVMGQDAGRVVMRAPGDNLEGLTVLRLGDLLLDPVTYRDQPLLRI
jgi:polynucleotide 5'-hydroxyl-kinase GRC3/NOL9